MIGRFIVLLNILPKILHSDVVLDVILDHLFLGDGIGANTRQLLIGKAILTVLLLYVFLFVRIDRAQHHAVLLPWRDRVHIEVEVDTFVLTELLLEHPLVRLLGLIGSVVLLGDGSRQVVRHLGLQLHGPLNLIIRVKSIKRKWDDLSVLGTSRLTVLERLSILVVIALLGFVRWNFVPKFDTMLLDTCLSILMTFLGIKLASFIVGFML